MTNNVWPKCQRSKLCFQQLILGHLSFVVDLLSSFCANLESCHTFVVDLPSSFCANFESCHTFVVDLLSSFCANFESCHTFVVDMLSLFYGSTESYFGILYRTLVWGS